MWRVTIEVNAKSFSQAVRNWRKGKVVSCAEFHPEQLEPAIGFGVEFPVEDEWEDEDTL